MAPKRTSKAEPAAKLLLLDGNSLAYRAFFALPTDMATASGQVTNAVFGFTSMLINLLRDHKPDLVAVSFDRPEPTFRHAMADDYKAGRAEAPDILRQQMGLVRQVVDVLAIPELDLAGYEADDIIATVATQARDRNIEVIIVTGDRDVYQLVEDPLIKVLYNRRGVSDYALYDEAGIKERTGVDPVLYPQYAALRGDTSDNIPGVPGVGEKTAAKLLNDYGSLEGVFANLESCTPKLRQNLAEHEDQVYRNALLTPLVRDVPIEVDVARLRMGDWDRDATRQLFNFLEFRTLWDRLVEALGDTEAAPAEAARTVEVSVTRPDGAAAAADEVATLCDAARVAVEVAWQGAPGRSAPAGIALMAADPSAPSGTAVWLEPGVLADQKTKDALVRLLGRTPVVAHRAKEIMRGLRPLGLDIRNLEMDTAVAAYLLDPAEGQYLLEEVCLRYAQVELSAPGGAPAGQLDLAGDGSDPAVTAAERTAALAAVTPTLERALDAQGLRNLHDQIERPLVRVLARMEEIGIRVDSGYLEKIGAELTAAADRLERQIHELAGEVFNVNSTLQLRTVLFDRLGLAPQKRTKTGFSTDAQSLEKLRGQHPVIDALLQYREVEKLRSTYGEGLLAEVAPDGRIHASFNQTIARTGRLSSDQPNLHNIPVRSEEGRRFRRAFVPADGCRFLVADYNQIELRVIAHLSDDPGLVDAFTAGRDIHQATAARIFGVAPEKVDIAQRSKAKMVSYGLAYGMEAYGLSQRLGVPVDEAAAILDAYFEGFPSVRSYMEATVAEARRKGYTETIFGRRRLIPELSSSNYRLRQAGERQAMNAGIQGLAADIFKVALVRLDAALEDEGLRSRLVLQVHDEVILEVVPEEEERAAELTVGAMSGAAELSVPLIVSVAWGDSWADAKG
ncbi:MAG TPA: DNA polymerase I, partial [Acidimicrobiales bacterium]|nr:DNA polymerase I [Acidimicrobiales bacterium]